MVLFKKLDKKSLEKNYGYEITINGKNIDSQKFFYEKEKVKLAVKGMKTVEEYIELIRDLHNENKKLKKELNK